MNVTKASDILPEDLNEEDLEALKEVENMENGPKVDKLQQNEIFSSEHQVQ